MVIPLIDSNGKTKTNTHANSDGTPDPYYRQILALYSNAPYLSVVCLLVKLSLKGESNSFINDAMFVTIIWYQNMLMHIINIILILINKKLLYSSHSLKYISTLIL